MLTSKFCKRRDLTRPLLVHVIYECWVSVLAKESQKLNPSTHQLRPLGSPNCFLILRSTVSSSLVDNAEVQERRTNRRKMRDILCMYVCILWFRNIVAVKGVFIEGNQRITYFS